MKRKPINIITNHNPDKIKVKSEYDEKCNVIRTDVRLKTSKRGQNEK